MVGGWRGRVQFLSYLPENQGGLYPVAVGLFHTSELVRQAAVNVFQRIASFPVRGAGVGLWSCLCCWLTWGGVPGRVARRSAASCVDRAGPQAGAEFMTTLNPYLRMAYTDLCAAAAP